VGEFYETIRGDLVKQMQNSIGELRKMMGLSGQAISRILGVTRQTVNNLESGKTPMTAMHYIAYAALLDDYISRHPNDVLAIRLIFRRCNMATNIVGKSSQDMLDGQGISYLRQWFACFPSEDDQRLMEVSEAERFLILARQYKIFIHFDSLMEEGCDDFFKRFAPWLQKENNSMIVSFRVLEALQKLSVSNNEQEKEKAERALQFCTEWKNRGRIDIRGEIDDIDMESIYFSIFPRFKNKYRLLLIAQKENLRQDILNLNTENHLKGFPIIAGYLTVDGGFVIDD